MPDETRHESEDLKDYTDQEPADSLMGGPGDDPAERGIATPQHWSTAMRFGSTAEEQREGESLDQLLTEEQPDPALTGVEDEMSSDDEPDSYDDDEDAADEDVDGLLLDDGPDPRAGRLVAEDEGAHPDAEADLVARDAGVDGGAATAEEAAVHVVEADDTDVRSDY